MSRSSVTVSTNYVPTLLTVPRSFRRCAWTGRKPLRTLGREPVDFHNTSTKVQGVVIWVNSTKYEMSHLTVPRTETLI